MEIDPEIESKALEEAFRKYPGFAVYRPHIVARALFRGHAFQLEYGEPPPRDDPDTWEFQNTVVKAYRRLAGI
jgi:hypothetical protein